MKQDLNEILKNTLIKEKIITMIESGVFDLPSGKIEINLNDDKIQNIHIHRLIYKRNVIIKKSNNFNNN